MTPQPEETNNWTFKAYGRGKISPEQVNNERMSDGHPGLQAAIRNIFHGRESAFLLMKSEGSGSGKFSMTGAYNDVDVADGYIMTRDSDGLSRVVFCASVTGLNIDSTSKCIVARNSGSITVTEKVSATGNDVILAVRGGNDSLVDVRNLSTEDDILVKNMDSLTVVSSFSAEGDINIVAAAGSVVDLHDAVLSTYMIGVDSDNKRCITLREGEDISDAITALNGDGKIIILPGTYTDSITLSNAIEIVGSGMGLSTITGTVTISHADCKLRNLNVGGRIVVNNGPAKISNVKVTYVSGGGYGIQIAASVTDVLVESSFITGNFTTGIYCGDSCLRITVTGCEITGMTSTSGAAYGIYMDDCEYCVISFNRIHTITTSGGGAGASGIYCNGLVLSSITGNWINNIKVDVTSGAVVCTGITLTTGDVCKHNTVSGNVIDTIDCDVASTDNTTSIGILFNSCSYCSATANTITTIGTSDSKYSYGIRSVTANYCTYTGNTVSVIVATGGSADDLAFYSSGGDRTAFVGNNGYSYGGQFDDTNDQTDHTII